MKQGDDSRKEERSATHIGVVDDVRENYPVSQTGGLVCLVLGNHLRAVEVVLNGNYGDVRSQDVDILLASHVSAELPML